jgi:hypothetical protein
MTSMRRSLTVALAVLALAAPAEAQKKKSGKKPTTGMINIMSPAAGATVEVDGLEVGTVPVEPIEVGAGEHEVKVRKIGHMEFAETVNVGAGESVDLMVDLIATAGVLTVESSEPDAFVMISGKPAGKTPLKDYEVVPGDHVLVVKKEGFAPYNQKLNVLAGGEYTIRATLAVKSDKDAVAAAPGAPAPAAAVAGEQAAPAPMGGEGPVFTRWWFLLGAAAVVGGAVAGVIVLSPPQYVEKDHNNTDNQVEACGGAPCDVVIVPGLLRR